MFGPFVRWKINSTEKKLGEPLTNVSYHVRMLHDLGCIELSPCSCALCDSPIGCI